jgi:hypothetical protein
MTPLLSCAWAVLCIVGLAGCADAGDASFGDDLSDPQVPARGAADLPRWLAAAHYQGWHCEPAPHPARALSPHGVTRICSNDALRAAGDGAFPVGAASVKEIFDGGRIAAYAVSRRVAAGQGGDGWYWFEGDASRASGNADGVPGCTGCHGQAPRDYVFTVVP